MTDAEAFWSTTSTARRRRIIPWRRFWSRQASIRPRWGSRCGVMPEGDSIYRAARTLHRALAGKPVVRFESMLPALTRVHDDHPITGRTIESVRSAGKHLLMTFSGGLV